MTTNFDANERIPMAEQTYGPGAYDAHIRIQCGESTIRETRCRLDLDRPKGEDVLRSYMVDLALKGQKAKDFTVLQFRVSPRR